MTIPYLNSFTKIFSKEINLIKPIQDKNIRMVYGYRKIIIIDKDDIPDTHNNLYLNFLNISKTEYFDQVVKFSPYYIDYIIYPYLDYVSHEDMKAEPIDEIKRYNYFIKDLPNNYTKSIIIAKLERVDDRYYMNYYMNANVIRSIASSSRHIRANLLIKILMEQKTIDILSETEKSLKIILSNIPERVENYNLDDQDLLKTGVELYQYQKNDISWMKSIEQDVFNGNNSISYDYCMALKFLNNDFVLYKECLYPGNSNIENYKLQVQFNYQGGNLVSEMGLGKSLIMLYHILEENKKTEEFYNPYVEFADNCNYFYKRGKNRGNNCLKKRVSGLYCKEHSKSIFIDKRCLKFRNLEDFDIRNYMCVVDNKEFIKTNASIIICPNHLCDQWVQEYYSKFNNNNRVVLIVTGDQYSNITFSDLLFADVVVISYNFLLNKICNDTVYKRKLESVFSKYGFTLNRHLTLQEKKDLLMSKDLVFLHLFYWNRVILDEVHEIQNMPKANALKEKISNFSSIYKWNISGTPFANNVTSFINLMSYNTDYGKAYYNFDICKNECINLKVLVEFGLDSDIINKCKFLFRRNTKQSIKDEYDGSIIRQNVHLLDFTLQERSIYDSYIQDSNRHLNFLIKLCCHPELNHDTKEMIRNCKTFDEIQKCMLDYNKRLLEDESNKITTLEIEIDYYQKQLNEIQQDPQDPQQLDSIKCKLQISRRQYTVHKKNHDDISRTYNYLKNSIEKLKDSSSECVCPICLDDIDVNNIVITKCGHKFCWDCLYETHKIRKDTIIKCPTCNLCMKNDEVYLLKDDKTNYDEISDLEKIIKRVKSTKIGNIIYYLKNSIKPKDKVILFSQWDEMLHKVGDLLKDTGINIVYCNGSVYQRKRAITNFTKNDDVNIILLSSRNAASGINLTVSNKIIFLEPIYGTKDYRTSIESQAVGRADRIGQKRPIEIHRFLIKQTVEEDIYDDLIDDTKLKQLNMK